ncbi:guanylate kinase [Rhodanobacter sp. Root480]|uniref:guanylate kinase n=1 Tax=unclassified Rhodanobacter TaxID=2621553 RepID=UPI0006FF57D1|nr:MULTISPECIES: guanylate kinase [unclassified Rhodanobacter]KQX96491.1 guanylate kinase [Rhodanobacter sp. Root480]KRA31647.1 guanylate kinase [Rhodanobacter sp. Root627]
MNIEAGTLFVVAAPSGAGKSSLVNALLEREPTISLSISHTTRPPRVGELYGRHYYFVERDAFEKQVAEGIFLEHAEVHGNLYGTSGTTVQALLAQGRDVLLEIDWQGAQQIRRSKPDCVSVFILPPSRAELERRLRGRGSDSAAVIERRLRNSREEIGHAHEFDFILINDVFNDALDDLQAIVRAVRQRSALQWRRHETLIAELLAS